MKTTIKKLINLGLNEEIIKKELNIDDKRFQIWKERNKTLRVENVPELLEKYNKTKEEEEVLFNSTDAFLCRKLDEIYQSLGLEILSISPKDKADIYRNIPNFVQNIRKEVGVKKIEKLQEKINAVNKEIEKLRLEYNIVEKENCKVEVEYKRQEPNFYYFSWKNEINPNSPCDFLGKEKMLARVNIEMFNKMKNGDRIIIDDKFSYIIEEKKMSYRKSDGKLCARYLRLRLM